MPASDAIIHLRTLVGETRLAFLTSRAPNAELHARPLTIGEIDDAGNLAFLVDGTADWVRGLAADEQVNVSISNESDRTWVSVAGTARISEQRTTIHRLWTDEAARFFPGGPDDPSLRVLLVAASSAEYWDAPSTRIARLAGLAKSALGDASARLGESGAIDLA